MKRNAQISWWSKTFLVQKRFNRIIIAIIIAIIKAIIAVVVVVVVATNISFSKNGASPMFLSKSGILKIK